MVQANATAADAAERFKHAEPADAARIQGDAASELSSCLAENRHERNAESRRRLGEMWLFAGEYMHDAGSDMAARVSLERAKTLFYQLRRSGARGKVLVELAPDESEVKTELARL